MAHSKEPWRLCSTGDAIVCDDAAHVKFPRSTEDRGDAYDGAELVCESVSDADARRIIACVNILADVPTEILERVINAGARLSVFDDPSGGLNCDLVEASDE